MRPSTPFPRPQAPQQPRPPGIYQQRSVPQLVPSPQQPLLRGSTVDLPDTRAENANEGKTSLESLRNKQFSMSSASFDIQNKDERRYSISSVDENKQMQNNEQLSRPGSRADGYMNKITEGVSQPNKNYNMPTTEETNKIKHNEPNGVTNDAVRKPSPIPPPTFTEKLPAKTTEYQTPKPNGALAAEKDTMATGNNLPEAGQRPVFADKPPVILKENDIVPEQNAKSTSSNKSPIPFNEAEINARAALSKSLVNTENAHHVKDANEERDSKINDRNPTVTARISTPDVKIPIKSKASTKKAG